MASIIAPSVWLNTRPTSSPVPHLGCRRRRRTWAVIWFSAWCVVVDWVVSTHTASWTIIMHVSAGARESEIWKVAIIRPRASVWYCTDGSWRGFSWASHECIQVQRASCVLLAGSSDCYLLAQRVRECQIMMHVIAIPFFFNIENCTSGDLNAKIFQYKSTFRVQKLFAVVPSFL